MQQILEFVANTSSVLDNGGRVGVHCTAGMGRAGTMLATYFVYQGSTALDDDINDTLTSWTLDGGEFTKDRPVTPRSLTSHTSGLGDGFGFPGYDPSDPLPTLVQIFEGNELSNVGPLFMERAPMTFEEYSGGGVTLRRCT